jgi:hypothetical protein
MQGDIYDFQFLAQGPEKFVAVPELALPFGAIARLHFFAQNPVNLIRAQKKVRISQTQDRIASNLIFEQQFDVN